MVINSPKSSYDDAVKGENTRKAANSWRDFLTVVTMFLKAGKIPDSPLQSPEKALPSRTKSHDFYSKKMSAKKHNQISSPTNLVFTFKLFT